MDFSVYMCVYGKDKPEWFSRAVESTLNQTKPASEFVLVVDGPVLDELNALIENYEKNPIFKVVRLEKNMGHGIARDTAIKNCTHEIIAIMDADDVCMPNRFERQIACFEEDSELDAVGTYITEFVDSEDNIVSTREVPLTQDDIREYAKKRSPMNNVTVMYKKSAIEACGGYVDGFGSEDYYLWVRMICNGSKMKNLAEVLVNVRTSSDLYKRRGGMKFYKGAKTVLKFMYKNKMIGFGTYTINSLKRFCLHVLMPSKMRNWAFKKFARKTVK